MKLKPIPSNTVVHTPTEAEAKELLAILNENGWKWVDRTIIAESRCTGEYLFLDKENEDVSIMPPHIAKTSAEPILALAEFKERFVDFDDTLTDDCQSPVKIGKGLNLCELLKGHEGEEFFSPISNNPLKLKAVFGRSLTFFLDEEEDLTVDFDGGGRIIIPSLNGDSQLKYITDLKSRLFFTHKCH